jgi:hypothetical protein
MSLSSINLSTLNSPCLVTAAGIALYGSAPLLQKFALEASLPVLAVARALSYSINIASVSVPGRMDGDASEMKEGPMSARKGTSLVTPRGWAFAIWGPIFLGELISVLAPFFSLHHHHTTGKHEWMVNMIRTTSGPFIRAQLFQSLWCAAFRPKYTGYARWISTGMLSMTAFCLNEAHRTLTIRSETSSGYNSLSVLNTAIYSLPIALHFGWTTAASLVNLNGSVSHFSNTLSQKTRNIIGHLSVGLATCVGLFITIQRHAPIYGGVIAWALSAVADGMNQRLMGGVDKDDDNIVVDSSSTTTTTTSPDKQSILVQRFLCKTGALMNIFAMAFVTELGVLSWNRQGLNNSVTSSSLTSF